MTDIATAIASAPSAPPPAAPPAAPAPATSPTPAPTSPSTGAGSPSTTPAAAPPVNDGTAVPATPSGPQPPTPPNPKEFGSATDWYMADTAYQQELAKFKEEHPEVTIPEPVKEAPKAEEVSVEAAKTEETQQQEAKTEDGESFSLDDEASLTPQALNDLIKAKPEREAYLNSDPEFKNTLMKLTREHAEMLPIRGIFPSADSAKFAKKEADRKVQLTAKFQNADSREAIQSALDDFAQEFAVIGADGKQVVDEAGDPVYGDDYYAMGEAYVERYADNTLADIEKRLAANQYASEDEKTRDLDRKVMCQLIKEDLDPSETKKDPDPSGVPEHLRADMQKRLDDIKAREAALETQSGKAAREKRKAARDEATGQFFDEIGPRTRDQVNKIIDSMRKAGALIPEWQLESTIPGTNTSAFLNEVGKGVTALLESDPYTRKLVMDLEAAPPTPENLAARISHYDSVLNRTNEKGVKNLTRIVRDIVRKHGERVRNQAAAIPEPKTTAAPEPKGGAAPGPKVMTRDDAYKQAVTQLSKEVPGWNDLQPQEQMAYAMTRQMQLMTAKR